MSEEQEQNGERKVSRNWPNTIQAAAMTGLSRKKLDALVASGALYRALDSSGVLRWDPTMLAVVSDTARNTEIGGEEPDAGTTLGAETVAMLRQAHGHLESTLKLVLAPSQALLDRALAENERLRARVAALELKRDELAAEREKVLSELHLRDMLTLEVQQTNKRKDQALELARDAVPKLLAAVNPEAKAVVALVQSLTAEQRDMLLLTELLTPEQKDQVRALLAKAAPSPAAAPEEGPKS